MKRRTTYQKPPINWKDEFAQLGYIAFWTTIFFLSMWLVLEFALWRDGW